MTNLTRACDALARALGYPGDDFRQAVTDAVEAVEVQSSAAGTLVRRFAGEILALDLDDAQELYARTFDFNPRCTLDLGWHVFGDAYDRGALMAVIREDLRAAGVPETSELPDHLPQVLRLIGRLPLPRAGEVGAFATLALDEMIDALSGLDNPYEHLLRGVADTIRGVPAAGVRRSTGE
jgi:nitrate reductase delta subunit